MAENEWQQRFTWLEQEQRKDRAQLMALQERMVRLEGQFQALETQLREALDELAQWSTLQVRIQALEEQFQRWEQEWRHSQEGFQRKIEGQLQALQNEMRTTFARLTQEIAALREDIKALQTLDQRIGLREEEDQKLHRRIDQVAADLLELERRQEERMQVVRLLQEAQERNARRLLEMQHDLTALRKRLEELAGAQAVFGETLRKMEQRLQEVYAAEEERRREQREFLDKVGRQQAEYAKEWKVWEARIQAVSDLMQRLENQMQALDAFRQELNRARERLEDLVERMERRIHEVAEMQRLAEDRFRQEWLTFRADEQKRWATFQLSYEEQHHEVLRRLDQHQSLLDVHEEALAQVKDLVDMLQEQTQKRLQELHHLARTWMEEFDRLLKAFKAP